MVTLADLPPRPPKILLWGKPGSGKTPFVTSFGSGMQFVDTDDGLLSSKTLKDAWTAERLKVDIVQLLEKDPTKATAYYAVKTHIAKVYEQCMKGTYPHKILAIDSFTTLGDFAIRSILGNAGKLGSPVTIQQWGLAIGELENLFVYLKALPIPVVVIFHDRETTEGETVVQEISIFGRNLPRKIVSMFDEVLKVKVKTELGKMVPYLQTVPDAFTVVRSRAGLVDGFRTEKGFRELINLMGWKT